MSSGVLDSVFDVSGFSASHLASLCSPVCKNSILLGDLLVTFLQGVSLKKIHFLFQVLAVVFESGEDSPHIRKT